MEAEIVSHKIFFVKEKKNVKKIEKRKVATLTSFLRSL